MQSKLKILQFIMVAVLLSSCYNHENKDFESLYDIGYNFIVDADSLPLLRQQPEEKISDLPTDTFAVYNGDLLVVADIRSIPTDSVDSVWVQVAKDQETFGWTHSSQLLDDVVPDDPISQFIKMFSDSHVLITMLLLVCIVAVYMVVLFRRKNVPMVFFNDIGTFYPTMLCIIVACAATFYSSLQLFAKELWTYFYYHPTLNPFSVPPILGIFLASVWAIIIIGIAAVDDVRRHLPIGDALLYIGGMCAVSAVGYIVFSISTLYYIGYPLLLVYIVAVLRHYWLHWFTPYICGNCGSLMRRKGRCPHCGTMNE